MHAAELNEVPTEARVPGLAEIAAVLIDGRRNVSPRRLVDPGPDAAQLDRLLRAAGAAPDHGGLRPWRFVLVPPGKRCLLAEVFAVALRERDAGASAEQEARAREKAYRAPLLMLAVARLGASQPDIPVLERMVSVGCAIQNLLLAAQAMGYGSGLASGQAMTSAGLRRLFGLAEGEEAVCFVNVGTVRGLWPPRPRPQPAAFFTSL